MSCYCPITKKKPLVGNNVSHANNKTKRRFLPNIHVVTLYSLSLKRDVSLSMTAKGLKTIFKYGGLDGYLNKVAPKKLEGTLLHIHQEMVRKNLLS